MPRVVFVRPDGTKQEAHASDGASVMQAATAHLVPGIVAECGGELSCATCHVFVDEQWLRALPVRSEDEEEMLEATSEEPTDASRLCCQITLDASLDGIVVHIPKTQK
ncbi:ferredoxin, 2Fe-2S [Streptomyces sp. cf124]|uniref:2Fe-2S iron-sulfur cluster-binding protein n=1 Tax=Streptomyces sp. cf124 TaxID=1761903 RepID=UPI0008E5B91D|nr:2Fe-2S iron-sulfur cluster-binding protein [Streptomyces sp. cf124]SFN07103.1 ferredoxin, 2Fe-2S [Streptomyces sp. cf124]